MIPECPGKTIMPRKNKPSVTVQKDAIAGATAPVVYAQHETVSSKQSFRKAHEAIFLRPVKGRLTLAIRKGYNVLIKTAQEQGPDLDEFVLDYRVFTSLAESDSSNYEFLKDLGRRYVGTLVEWDSLSDEGRRRFGVAALLSRWELIDGKIHFAFDKRIKERLLVPEIYARISLGMQGKFRSSFALAIYEIAVRYATNPSRVTPRRPWTDWRGLMFGKEDIQTYSEFKYFNRVLKRAIEEVNAVTDLDVQCIIFRQGKTVTDLQFKITEKQQQGLEFSDPNILNSDLTQKLLGLGLKPQAAIKVMNEHDEASIEAALAATKKRALKKGAEPLASPAAYFLHLLREGHFAPGASEALPSPNGSQEDKAAAARDKVLQDYYDERAKEAEGLFRELAESEQEKFTASFREEVVAKNKALAAAYKKGGLKSALVKKSFYRWFGDQTWGHPTDTDLLNFAMRSRR